MGSTVSVDAGAGPNLSSTANRQTGVRSGKRDRRIVAAAGPTHGSVSRCLAGPMFKPGTLCPCDQTYPIDKVPGGVDLSGYSWRAAPYGDRRTRQVYRSGMWQFSKPNSVPTVMAAS